MLTRRQVKKLAEYNKEKDNGSPQANDQSEGSEAEEEARQDSGDTVVPQKQKIPIIPKSVVQNRRDTAAKFTDASFDKDLYTDMLNYLKKPFTLTELIEEQKNDSFCAAIRGYILKQKLPQENALAREILLTHDHYFMYRNVLFRYLGNVRKDEPSNIQPQLVIPIKWASLILGHLHDTPMGAHVGMNKLFSTVRPRFYWRSMLRDIHDHVASCHACLKSKHIKHPIKLPMKLHDKAPGPFIELMIDAIGPMRRSRSGNKYIQVVVDVYSRFVIAWPTREITARKTIKELFDKVICCFGVPMILYSDNCSNYKNSTFKKACKAFGIKQIHGSPYSPTSQGLVERNIQSITQSLRTFVNKNQSNWCEYISAIVFGLNNSSVYSLGYSPYLLVYGRNAITPPETALVDIRDDLFLSRNSWLRS